MNYIQSYLNAVPKEQRQFKVINDEDDPRLQEEKLDINNIAVEFQNFLDDEITMECLLDNEKIVEVLIQEYRTEFLEWWQAGWEEDYR